MPLLSRAAAALAAMAFSASVAIAAPPEIRWDTRPQRAAARSRETGKPILVEFWATWCPECKGMDEEVYSDPAVSSAMTKVLPVRIDIDRDPSIARRYGVSATPTLVLMDAAGNELFRFTGRLERAPMLELLHEIPGDIRRVNDLAAALTTRKADFVALDALASELRGAALFLASNRYYERALQTENAKRDAGVRTRLLASIGQNYTALNRPADAAEWFGRALREARGLPAEPEIMLDLARAQIAANRTKDARATLDELQQRFKGTPAAAEAKKLLLPVK